MFVVCFYVRAFQEVSWRLDVKKFRTFVPVNTLYNTAVLFTMFLEINDDDEEHYLTYILRELLGDKVRSKGE